MQSKALAKSDYFGGEGQEEGQGQRVTEHKYLNVLSHVHHIRSRYQWKPIIRPYVYSELRIPLARLLYEYLRIHLQKDRMNRIESRIESNRAAPRVGQTRVAGRVSSCL